MDEPSVCLSPVTLLHPTHRVEVLYNIFSPFNSLGLGQFVLKFWEKIKRVLGDRKWKGIWKLAYFDHYLDFISKTVKTTAIVAMED